MAQHCPDCQKILTDFSLNCENCGWSLTASVNGKPSSGGAKEELKTGYELHYHSAYEAIERGDFATAQLSINRAIKDATPQQRCEALALRGYGHLKNSDFSEAEQACSQAIHSGWSDARTYAWRAAARSRQFRFHLALDDLNDALDLAGGDEDQYLAMLNAYLKKARDYYGKQLTANPQDATSLWQRGWVYYRTMIFDKAERDFKSALQFAPGLGWGWVGLANIALIQDLPDEAVKLATKAVEDADVVARRAAYFCRARAWSRIDGADGCTDDLEELQSLAGENPELIYQLAKLKLELHLFAAAISDCDHILRQNGDYIQAFLLRGTALARMGNHRAALKDLSAFVHAFPSHAIALTERARTLAQLNEPDRALSDLETAIRLEPRYKTAYLERARVYLQKQQYELAAAALGRVVELDPQHAEAAEVTGRLRFANSDFQSAVDEFSRAIDLAKSLEDKAGYLFLRGTTFYELGQFELAAYDFETACSLRPNHAGSWIWMAAVDSRLENWTRAIQSLQKAIISRPASAKQYMQLGRPVARKAVGFFSKMIERGQTDSHLYRDRGLAFHFLNESQSAIDDFARALELVPDDLETRLRRGQLYQRQSQHELAIHDFSHIIHRDKIHHSVRYYRAVSYFSLGDTSRASSDVLKAIELDPRQARYHILRGELVQREGRVSRAIRCFDRAISLDPQNATPRRLKGQALALLGHYPQAMTELDRATELAPDQAEGWIARGQLLLQLKQFADAEREFERAIIKNPQSLKAYLGKSSALMAQGHFHKTVIWLTKSLHQFPQPEQLAELLMKRGRAFYKMGLSAYAVNDFTACLRTLKSIDMPGAASARFARGLAYIQKAEFEAAKRDFEKLGKRHAQQFPSLGAITDWLENRKMPPPADIFLPERMQKMPKPKVVRPAKKLVSPAPEWNAQYPFDTWVLRVDGQEYGPIPKATLDRWMEQGRIAPGMKVVRGDWPRWKHVEKVYRELMDDPSHR